VANYEHLLLLKQGVSHWNEWRRKHLHTPIDLVRADLRGLRLRWVDLRDADLSGADLSQACLQGADLRWANLAQANLTQTDLQGATLSFANLQAANLAQTNFRAADLRAAQLQSASLETADFSGAILSESDLTSADLHRLELPGNNLTESEFIAPATTTNEPLAPSLPVDADLAELTLEQFNLIEEDAPESEPVEKTTYVQDDTLHDWHQPPETPSQNGALPGWASLDPSSDANTLEDWINSYDDYP
jgi:hypothetical protein